MFNKQKLSLFPVNGKVSLFKKKLAAVFIFACMSVNGFAPSTIEISRYSLVMVMAVVTQNVVSEVFSRYNDSLIFVSNKVTHEIMEFLDAEPLTEFTIQQDKGNRKDKTSNNETLVIKQAIVEERKVKENIKSNASVFFVQTVKLFNLYHSYKIPDRGGGTAVFILLFILLMIKIVRKKEYDESALNIINRVLGKIRISA